MTAWRCRHLWTRLGVVHDTTVVLDGERVVEVRPARQADGPFHEGLVVPGLINAHTHLELSDVTATARRGLGFFAWFRHLRAQPRHAVDVAAVARALADHGTAAIVDVTSRGDTLPAIASAGLHGIVQHEVLGFDREHLAERIRAAEVVHPRADLTLRSAPHALLSTPAALVHAAVRGGPPGVPSTLHIGETPDEDQLLHDGTGPAAAVLDALGRDWRWWTPPGLTAVAHLHALGVLGPNLLLVHVLHLSDADRHTVLRSGSPVCLCPRSNLHVAGRLPDADRWWQGSATVLLGTDSLASSPDLDVLAEIPVLARAFPGVPAAFWLSAVTHTAADALGLRHVGAIEPGRAPGLLQLDVGDVHDLGSAPPFRRWLVRPAPPTLATGDAR